jgi:hypothetical protein
LSLEHAGISFQRIWALTSTLILVVEFPIRHP